MAKQNQGLGLKKTHLLLFFSLVVGVGAFYPFNTSVQSHAKLVTVQDGSNICFSRVIQSFTARMIGDTGSAFLTPEFLSLTGECYSDLVENFQKFF